MHGRNLSLLFNLLLGSFFAAGIANGQDTPESETEARIPTARRTVSSVLRESDENGDGMLQRTEAPILILSNFDEIDRDHDNQIDSFEAWEYDARVRRQEESTRRSARRAGSSKQAPRTVRTLF